MLIAVVQDVRLYAERTKTSLNALLRAYMEKLADEERVRRAQESESVYAYLMGQGGWLPDGYSFDRERANER